jgi:nicotinate-nucleotide adenylyltransferase
MMRGILGGTFDPVHHGHLRAALDVAEACDCLVHLVPAAIPPHRDPPRAAGVDRLRMLELAVAGQPRLLVDDREFRRDGPSYTVDTLRDLRREFGDQTPLLLLVGMDAFAGLSTWSRWTELFELAHIGVMTRPGHVPSFEAEVAAEWYARRVDNVAALAARAAGRVLPIDVTPLPISSTDLRARLAAGRSIDYLVPPAVAAYIRERALYDERTVKTQPLRRVLDGPA